MKNWHMLASKKVAEISIEGVIGDGWEDGVTAAQFIRDLKSLGDVEKINLRIYSPGGSVIEGNAIFNALLSHPAKVVAQIDFAASMATVIAMAADEIIIAENGYFMIHNPWGVTAGDSDDMRKTADLLDKMKAGIVAAYKRHAQISERDIAAMMDEETWMTADQAVDLGFATAKSPAIKVAAVLETDLLKNIPEDAKQFLAVKTPAAPAPVMIAKAEADALIDTARAEGIAAGRTEASAEGERLMAEAVAKAAADADKRIADAVAAATFAAKMAQAAALEAANKESAERIKNLETKIESMTAGFEYEPEKRGQVNGTAGHPFFAALAELKAQGLTDEAARKKLDETNPTLRQSLIAQANKKR